MSFTLADQGAMNNELIANVWNWKPTLEIIRSFNVIDDSQIRQMQVNASGSVIDEDIARELGALVRERFLAKMQPGQRVRLDLSVTDERDDGTFHRGADEAKNYGATYEFLQDFCDFCAGSKGFRVF